MKALRSIAGSALALLLMVTALVGFDGPSRAVALDGAGFDPGYIISDENFYNGNAMSEGEIQQFLNSTIGPCLNGQCLNVLRSDAASRSAVVSDSTGQVRCGAFAGGPNLSAAAIIHRAQVACGISAKVLLVTLQKEQGLVTKNAPSRAALDRAMGFACPDTAPCAVDSLGFANQVYKGALQLNTYRAAKFGRQPGVQYIPWHPNAACGGSQVNVLNYATAALYNYTPYRPNAAALANLGGIGDGCSSYGNRNFWVFYNNWFGPTGTAAGYVAVDSLYQSLGGANGSLGAPVSELTPNAANGGGLVRGFANGAIAWSAPRGAFTLTGEIRAKFNETGGIAAGLGWPASPANRTEVKGGGLVQAFQWGAITSSPTAGIHLVRGSVRAQFTAASGLTGPLGWPTQSEQCGADGVCTQTFQGGTVYWSRTQGSGYVLNAFAPTYAGTGGLGGSLGWPVTPPNALAANGGGVVQGFVGGAIAQNGAATPRIITGPIRAPFNAAGGLTGAPGWPTTNVACAQGGVCTQTFQGGTGFSQEGRGGYVSNNLLPAYAAAGGPTGSAGWPLGASSRVAANGGGEVQGFERAAIARRDGGQGYLISGGLRAYFNGLGGLTGPVGWPTSDAVCDTTGSCAQSFTGGRLSWSPASGGRRG